MQNHETPKLAYTIAEACHAVGIRRSKLYELIGQGRVQSIHPAGPALSRR